MSQKNRRRLKEFKIDKIRLFDENDNLISEYEPQELPVPEEMPEFVWSNSLCRYVKNDTKERFQRGE